MKKMYNILIGTMMVFFSVIAIGEMPMTLKDKIIVKENENSIEFRSNNQLIEIDKDYFEIKSGF